MIGSRLNLIVREGAPIQFLDAPVDHIWGLGEQRASIFAYPITLWLRNFASLPSHYLAQQARGKKRQGHFGLALPGNVQ
jgi:hypothetical protein